MGSGKKLILFNNINISSFCKSVQDSSCSQITLNMTKSLRLSAGTRRQNSMQNRKTELK